MTGEKVVRTNQKLLETMRHNRIIITFLGIFCLVLSCSKNDSVSDIPDNPVEQPDQNKPDAVKTVSFNVPAFKDTDEVFTKTQIGEDGTSFSWSANDTVGIYPSSGSQVYFTMDEGEGASSAQFDGGGWEFKQSAVYYSYYPFIGDIYLRRDYIPVSYSGQKQTGITGTSHIGPFDFMCTDATTASSGSLSFNYHHLGALLYVNATLPAGTYTKLAITAPSNAFVSKGYYNLVSSNPSIISTENSNQFVIDLENITLTEQTQFMVYMMIAPTNLNGVEITVSVLNDQKKEYQCKKTPSRVYEAGNRYGLTCSSFEEVPQSMGLIVGDWDDGGNISGDAE